MNETLLIQALEAVQRTYQDWANGLDGAGSPYAWHFETRAEALRLAAHSPLEQRAMIAAQCLEDTLDFLHADDQGAWISLQRRLEYAGATEG